MASPDTDELATVPLPAGQPEARPASSRAVAAGQDVGEVPAVRQEQAEPGQAEAPTVEQERVAPERIEPADASPDVETAASAELAKDRGRWWRGLTGSLAAGLVVLAVGVLVVGVICLFTGAPGPGAASLIGHPLAAVLALVAQRVADGRSGLPAAGGGAAVVLFAVSAATIFWLA